MCRFLPFIALVTFCSNPSAFAAGPTVSVAHPLPYQSATYQFPAKIIPPEIIDLRALTPGTVDNVNVKPGEDVDAGATLITLRSDTLDANLKAAQEKRRQAQRAYDAKKRQIETAPKTDALAIARLTAELEIEAANVKLAELDVAEIEQSRAGLMLVAPAKCRVKEVRVKPRDTVDAGSAVITLVRTAEVHATFEIDQPLFLRLREIVRQKEKEDPAGAKRLLLALGDSDQFQFTGFCRGESSATNVGKRVQLEATFPQPAAELLAAASAPRERDRRARVQVTLGEPREVWLVPQQVVLTGEVGGSYVYVVNDKQTIEMRPITLGTRVKDMVVAESGLTAKDWVVVRVQKGQAGASRGEIAASDFAADTRFAPLRPGLRVSPLEVNLE